MFCDNICVSLWRWLIRTGQKGTGKSLHNIEPITSSLTANTADLWRRFTWTELTLEHEKILLHYHTAKYTLCCYMSIRAYNIIQPFSFLFLTIVTQSNAAVAFSHYNICAAQPVKKTSNPQDQLMCADSFTNWWSSIYQREIEEQKNV